MTEGHDDVLRRRAERMLGWYPREWRARYGEEFVEVLIADMAEQSRSRRMPVDVALNGMVARFSYAGLGPSNLEVAERTRRTLLAFGCAAAVFVTAGLGMWAQMTIGWQWSPPDTVATSAAMFVMSYSVLALLAIGALALGLLAWPTAKAVFRGRNVFGWLVVTLTGAGILIVGSRHFANGWPGTGGHPWAHQGLVPGGVAAFVWAATLFITTYWAHPSALLAFPAAEIAWMVVSPVAWSCLAVGAWRVGRRVEFSSGLLRYEARLAKLGGAVMVVFLVGASLWVVDGGPGPRDLFHVGAIDIASIAVMVLALIAAGRALQLIGPHPRTRAAREAR